MAIKTIFAELMVDDELMRYFDTERVSKGKYPEKKFFWGILFTVRKELAQSLVEEVINRRLNKMDQEQNNDQQLQW